MRLSASALAAALIVSCGPADVAPPPDPRTPVFIVSIDTLRSDRLSVYGDGGAKTPAFERFRRDAILFQHAYSHTPLTLPSHASLLTGRLPAAHKVRDNGGYKIPAELPTIQKTLRGFGYGTAAAVSSSVLRAASGIAPGFQFFDEAGERPGDVTREQLAKWLRLRRGSNVFALLHIFEPHAPYEPPPGVGRTRTAYDGEVTAADAILGAFLDDIEKRGLYRDALIFVLSDHGEGLGDHGEDEHGVFLYREAIQIPLLVKLPGNRRAGETVSHAVALVDVVPTILEVLQLPAIDSLDGRSLLSSPQPRRIYSETFFPRLHLGWSESFSLLDGEHHYIHAPRSELYRYRADPAETTNLIANERRVAAAMREELETIDRSLAAPAAISQEDRQALAALGYLGSASPASGELPDAKDRILNLRALKSGYAAFRGGEYTRAAALLRTLTRQAPELADGWALLAESQLQLGQEANALSTLRAAAARFPTHSDIRGRLGGLLLRAGDLKGAEAELAAAIANSSAARRSLHYQRAEALAGLGRAAEAEAELRREVELFPDNMEAWGALAAVLAGRNRLDQARQVLRLGLQHNPQPAARRVARDALVAADDKEGLRLLGLE